MVVKIMVPFGVPHIIRHLIFRVSKNGALILTTTHLGFGLRKGPVKGLGVGCFGRLGHTGFEA